MFRRERIVFSSVNAIVFKSERSIGRTTRRMRIVPSLTWTSSQDGLLLARPMDELTLPTTQPGGAISICLGRPCWVMNNPLRTASGPEIHTRQPANEAVTQML